MKKITQAKATTTSTLYEETIPVYSHFLENLLTIINKAERFAKQKKVPIGDFFSGRLAPDMYTFAQQVQYAYFLALDGASNLSGKKAPDFTYDEKTITELKKSLRRTITYLSTITHRDFIGAEKKKIPVFFDKKRLLSARTYVSYLGLPDFFFHYTTAYDIVRHLGVSIGKNDYLGVK
jgi:hypothetical protein